LADSGVKTRKYLNFNDRMFQVFTTEPLSPGGFGLVILGGGWAGDSSSSRCNKSWTSVSGCVYRLNYGFCHRIEPKVVKLLDPDGRRLFIAHFQGLIDKALPRTVPSKAKAIFEYSNDIRLPALSLKEIYLSTKSVAPYVALCDRL
jgi:hypothetical protein